MYRPNGLKDQNNTTVVSGVSYGPSNELLTMNYGYSETRTYNSMLQLTNLSIPGVLNTTYSYPAAANNGKINAQSDALSGEAVQYAYDALNRLITASTTAGPQPWGDSYSYDGFGNLTAKTVTQGSAPSFSASVDQNNHIVGASYDANGNMTLVNGISASYDVENRLTGYVYDAQNNRIMVPGTTDSYGNATGYTIYFYGANGQRLAAYQVNTAWLTNFPASMQLTDQTISQDTYFGSRRLAPLDRLGSARRIGGANTSFFPYGEDKGAPAPNDNWKFGTYWRDASTGLDYADNRYYSSTLGRFITPDPYISNSGGSGDVANPQSWNRYTYTRGDPVNRVDPNGMDDCDPGDTLPCTTTTTGDGDDGSGDTSGGGSGGAGGGSSPPVSDPSPCHGTYGKGYIACLEQAAARARVQAQWNSLSPDCQQALQTATPNTAIADLLAVLGRAGAAESILVSVAASTSISWAMLAAIGIRESAFQNKNQTNGRGVGIFQIDLGQHPSVTAAQAGNLTWAATYAANMLNSNMAILAAKFPTFTSSQLLQATAASYNLGVGGISGNPNTIDVDSPGDNYGSNVLGLMNCFH